MTDLAKTPWVDRTANAVWSRIVAASPKPAWVPKHTTSRGKVTVEEFGCGHYGCVMPTDDPEVVCKITSDATEAVFVAAALGLGFGEETEGIVRYFGVYELARSTAAEERQRLLKKAEQFEQKKFFDEGRELRRRAAEIPDVSTPIEHRGRRTFVLWRESAESVGLPPHWGNPRSYDEQRIDNLHRYLGLFKDFAAAARDSLKRSDDPDALIAEAKRHEDAAWDYVSGIDFDRVIGSVAQRVLGGGAGLKGPHRIAVALRACDVIAELMQNTDGCDLIGSALRYYLEQGILLADVHTQNVGKVERTSGWVITDPGHAVGLEARWRTVSVPELP